MKTVKYCLSCNRELEGRTDKKFCDSYCKSAYHYKKNKEGDGGFYFQVDHQLKKNRKILKTFNKAGKATVRAQVIHKLGFNPNFFTHYWKNAKNEVYLFVYEFGFLKKIENGSKKYVLVKWQPYMDKKLEL